VSDPPSPKDPQLEADAEAAVLDTADIVEDVKRSVPPRPPPPARARSARPSSPDSDEEPVGVFIAPMPIIPLSNSQKDGETVEVGATSIRRSSMPPRPPAPSNPPRPPAPSKPPVEPPEEMTPPRPRPPADSLIQPVPSPRPPLQSDPKMERPFASEPGHANGSSAAALGEVLPPPIEEETDVPIDDGGDAEPEPISVRRPARSEPESTETLPDEMVESAREPGPIAPHAPEPEEIEPEPDEERGIGETDELIAAHATDEPPPVALEPSADAEPPGDRVSEIPPEVDPADMEIHEVPAKQKPGIVLPLPLPLHARADLGAAVQAQHTAEGAAAKRARYWWDELFGDDFLRTMDRLTDDQILREVNFIEESLGLQKGGMILDLACGSGRHAVEMSVRGYNVVGYDLSVAMLARAADEAHDRNQKLNFLHGDMRDIGFEEMFDGVYCWSTSFGYFDDEKNFLVAQRIHRSLRKGGMLLLDVANRDFVTQRQPSLVWFEGEGCVCMDEMRVDFIHSRLRVKRMVMLDDGRTRELDYSIRLYTLHELGRLLHDVGFKVTEVSGHPATPGVFMGADSPRLIVLAEKA
jgi:SAM-dependent methyltransferase